MYLFYFFAAIVICLGLLSLRGGLRFAKYVRRETARPASDFTPFASVIAPCRGIDQGLYENIEALFKQNYSCYEIIFVADKSDDPALALIEGIRRVWPEARYPLTRILIAGQAVDSGQKVQNLRAAVNEVDPKSEVLVFVDTDAQPGANWLRSLVAPLQNEKIGATTGYRWFVPVRGGFASHLRSVWNASIASALGEKEEQNFCWGGSTAIRRLTFEKLNIRERWRGTVSDDFTMTRVLRETRLPIHFVPACLVASFADCGFRELFAFTNRQLKITRVYAPHLWQQIFIGSLLFTLVFIGGLVLVAVRAALGFSFSLPLVLLGVIFGLGAAKAWLRWQAITLLPLGHGEQSKKGLLAHIVLWPLASAVYLYNAIVAAFSRRIEWRGITYELKSTTEAVIISRES